MNKDKFNNLVEERVEKIKRILLEKSAEYSSDEDKLKNFKSGSPISGQTPTAYLWSLATKHLECIREMALGRLDVKYYDEKIGDAINYMILLEGLFKENLEGKIAYERFTFTTNLNADELELESDVH